MSAKDTGGPAFPQPILDIGGDSGIVAADEVDWGGMTLRDYFAAKAMVSILDQKDVHDGRECDGAAWMAYRMADAMLREREK